MANVDKNEDIFDIPSSATFSVSNTASSGRSTGMMVQSIRVKEVTATVAAPAPASVAYSEDGMADVRSASLGTPMKACLDELADNWTPGTPAAGG